MKERYDISRPSLIESYNYPNYISLKWSYLNENPLPLNTIRSVVLECVALVTHISWNWGKVDSCSLLERTIKTLAA